jgi:hypothetical protein
VWLRLEGVTFYQERVWILRFAWEIKSIFYISWAFQELDIRLAVVDRVSRVN